jgi:hypothetical protein
MFRTRCLILSGLLLTVACGSSQPTAPDGSVTPLPAPVPENPPPAAPVPAGFPVPERNTIYLHAPPPSLSTDTITGRYALEIAVTAPNSSGFRCDNVPQHARRRAYTADITNLGDHYAVLLYDARFVRDAGNLIFGCTDRRLNMNGVCHQFVLYREGASNVSASIVPEDEWRGSEIWEVLEDGRLLAFTGIAYGSFENGQIRASGKGSAWYGNGLPASEYGACQGDMNLTFTRR